MSTSLPAPIVAEPGDLPRAVAERLAATVPEPGEPATTIAAGIPFASIAWGDPTDRPLILIHGVTASSRIWWRVGPALAASGRRVVGVDLPGHGLTGHWTGHQVFRETAADVAAWIRAAGLDVPELQVVGHSWGGMTAAGLPIAGIRPATLVLLDPPAVPLVGHLADGQRSVRADLPGSRIRDGRTRRSQPGLVRARTSGRRPRLSSSSMSVRRARSSSTTAIGTAGWRISAIPAATGIPTWIVRGDPAAGGLLPDGAIPGFAARIGADHILTLAGAPHAPQRMFPEATVVGLLRALS